jgi:hypothetical protein
MSEKKQKSEQHTKLWADLMRSPSMRHAPHRAWLVTLAVLDELNRHRGKNNYKLIVPHKRLKFWLGTSDKTAITLARRQADALNLISTRREPGFSNGKRNPNLYGIPWLPGDNDSPPLHTWREIATDEQAKEILKSLKGPRRKTARYKTAEVNGQLGTRWCDKDDNKK